MKVLDIYDRNYLDTISCRGMIVSKIMDDFFKRYPDSYRINYDKNLVDLEIWKVDRCYDGDDTDGIYFGTPNILLLRKNRAIVHELMHMASFDREKNIGSIQKGPKLDFFDGALDEGITEYLKSEALGGYVEYYFFEYFVVNMLSMIDNFFEPYFIPNYNKFISLFPNKKDIVSLMYSLSCYRTMIDDFRSDCFNKKGREKLRESIKDTLNSLIDIQISFKTDQKENRLYAEEFMDLLQEEPISDALEPYFKDYSNYANIQINKRLLRR